MQAQHPVEEATEAIRKPESPSSLKNHCVLLTGLESMVSMGIGGPGGPPINATSNAQSFEKYSTLDFNTRVTGWLLMEEVLGYKWPNQKRQSIPTLKTELLRRVLVTRPREQIKIVLFLEVPGKEDITRREEVEKSVAEKINRRGKNQCQFIIISTKNEKIYGIPAVLRCHKNNPYKLIGMAARGQNHTFWVNVLKYDGRRVEIQTMDFAEMNGQQLDYPTLDRRRVFCITYLVYKLVDENLAIAPCDTLPDAYQNLI